MAVGMGNRYPGPGLERMILVVEKAMRRDTLPVVGQDRFRRSMRRFRKWSRRFQELVLTLLKEVKATW